MVAEGCLLAALARECFVVAVVIFERGTVGAHQHFGCVAVCAVCVFLVTQANGSDTPGLALAPHTPHPPPAHPTPLTLIGPEDRRVGQSEGG